MSIPLIDPNTSDAMNLDPPVPQLILADPPPGAPITTIPRTHFAGDYQSHFTIRTPPLNNETVKCLAHVNCSYLSTAGRAPTLTDLKQHAHSLAVLIKHLTLSTKGGLVDNANHGGGEFEDEHAFHQSESYDWLNNLSVPYNNDDHHHNIPLTSVLNRLEDLGEYSREICSLHAAAAENPPNGHSLPYASHQSLIQHANEILTLLDHEYSANGGLLSILPPKDQKEDREKAETTLLGQLILYMQRLVERLHDLEILYANSVDALAGEAIAPHQTLSKLGPKGRQSREVVFPQDRFILTNAGDDIWQFLQTEFDRKEASDTKADAKAAQLGVSGHALWQKNGGTEVAKGITALDITTRYYRLRNDPLKTVFVIPAHQTHPGVRVTREMEAQPTVVSVVKPVWPERASAWEMRNREDLERLKQLERDHARLVGDAEEQKQARTFLVHDREMNQGRIRGLEKEVQLLKDQLSGNSNAIRTSAVMEEVAKSMEMQSKLVEERQKLAEEREKYEKMNTELAEKKNRVEALIEKRQTDAQLAKEEADALNARSKERDADLNRAAHELSGKLKAAWHKQMSESQELLDLLDNPAIKGIINEVTLGRNSSKDAARKVQAIIDGIPVDNPLGRSGVI